MMIAAAVAAWIGGAGAAPEIVFRHASIVFYLNYADCLRNKAAVVGMFNEDDAQKIAMLVQPECATQWEAFRSSFMAEIDEPSDEDLQSMEYFRRLAIGSASSELVIERRGSCGTVPGPYQCKGVGKRK